MFTGLVQAMGTVESLTGDDSGTRLRIAATLAREVSEGDSVLVNGVCLTAIAPSGDGFEADLSSETLDRSSLAQVAQGDRVNLELALRASDRLGGHIVQGHVDGVGEVSSVDADGGSRNVRIDAPSELMRYVVEKGSIAVDGVSLTVTDVNAHEFGVSLIPETLSRTNLGQASPGRKVNLEVDVFAKYVEKLLGDRAS
jgi:riboflavin synthase